MHAACERPRVAEHEHERSEADEHGEHRSAARERRVPEEQIEHDEDQQQPLDLGDAARETAELGLLDLEAALERIAAHRRSRRFAAAAGRNDVGPGLLARLTARR